LEAIEAVCDAGGDLPVDVVDGVESLVEKSLLRRERGATDEVRLVMLETIHEYARERLEVNGERADVERAHAAFYTVLAERAAGEVRGMRQREILAVLDQEHDNLRAALTWGLSTMGDPEMGLRLAGSLGDFWYRRGYWSEGRKHLRAALTRAGRETMASRVRALLRVGFLEANQGDWVAAITSSEEACAEARTLGDAASVASALNTLGYVAYARGDFVRSEALLSEAVALADEAGDAEVKGLALNLLAWHADNQGDLVLAESRYEECLVLARAAGDVAIHATLVANLGIVHLRRHDYEKAEACERESLEGCRALGFKVGETTALINLGATLLPQGRLREALDALRQALIILRTLHNTPHILEAVESVACVAQAAGRAEDAVRLFGAGDALRASLDISRELFQQPAYERAVTAVRTSLTPAAHAASWAAGRVLTVEEVTAAALAVTIGP